MITQNKTAMELIPPHIYPLMRRCALVGSRVTCDPAPTDTDCDVMVLVLDLANCAEQLVPLGFALGGSGDGDREFESWTFEELNLILTEDPVFYNRFLAATTVCKHLNLMEKDDRKKLFRAVLHGEHCGLVRECRNESMEPAPW